MARTAARPLPSGRLLPGRALAFGLALCTVAVAVLTTVNLLAAFLAAAGIFYYVIVYTLWLKRASVWNVVIGGGAGVMPILVGWAGAAGELSPWAFWLGAIVFFWTPMHFWSLALFRQNEYAQARVPMLPVVLGEGETRRQILLYSLLLLAITLLPTSSGFTGVTFLLAALVMGALLIYRVAELLRSASPWSAQRLYRYSMIYLAVLFGCLILDRVMGWALLAGAS
jgi:protoheme IX farnesyltransferase